MKRIYNIFILLCLFTNIASAIPQLTSFTVKPNFLQNGKIKVYNNGTTEFIAHISASRGMNGTAYESVLAEVVFYMQIGSVQHELKTITLTSSYFSGSYLATYNEEGGIPAANNLVVIAIPQNIETGEVKVKYRYKDANDVWQPNSTYGYENYSQSYYQTINVGTTPYPPVIAESIIANIQAMGFSTTNIQNFSSTHYLVEGDVMLSKAYVSNWTTSTPASQVTTYNINILKPSFLWQIVGPWETAFFRAIHAWNSMPNCNIKLHAIDESTNIYSDARPIDISLVSKTDLASTPVVSSFPNGNGKPGSQIFINPNFKYPGTNSTPTIEQATWNLVQAIGHTLGFKHVIGTGTEASVMRINTSTSSYSSQLAAPLDANLISVIYPIDANSILTPSVMGVSTKSYMESNGFSISYWETGITYSWRVVGRNGTVWDRSYGEDYTSMLPELMLPIGQYQIRCTITGGKFGANPVMATKDITVY